MTALGRPLSSRERHRSGQLIHYSVGAIAGAVYGAIAERFRIVQVGSGLGFGLVLWTASVPGALPALRLSARRPRRRDRRFLARGPHCVELRVSARTFLVKSSPLFGRSVQFRAIAKCTWESEFGF